MEPRLQRLYENVLKVIVGKDETVRLALAALIARGHLLIEDAPGLGKTMLARAIAQSLHASFRRVQFTSDLLPSDITGVSVYDPARQTFEFMPGPCFTQVLLADEINRAPPRTQSSLLEAMEEHQITVDGRTHRLPEPFFVVATQNPVEIEGTYRLPEAQLDRFLFSISLGYPKASDEARILEEQLLEHPIASLHPVLAIEELAGIQSEVRRMAVSRELLDYVVAITGETRAHADVRLGASPRGSVALLRAAQAHAFILGFSYVPPDSVKAVAPHVLSHRMLLHPQREYAGARAADVVAEALRKVPVPTIPREKKHGASGAPVPA